VLAHPVVLLLSPDDPNFDTWGDAAIGIVVMVALWVWGDSRRMRRLQVELVEERALRAERERDEQARAAAREERTRIAREMHDIVAHSVSVMVVQAGAARRMVDLDPTAAGEAAGQIEATGRDALREMRRVLGVLRTDAEGRVDGESRAARGDTIDGAGGAGRGPREPIPSPAAEPQPGLAELDRLVAQCRDAGLDVRLRIDGDARALPSGIELAAYRIVQEALTNTMKHAGPARAEVRLMYADDAVSVIVADDGRGAAAEPAKGGHGLAGMRERVAVYGGEIQAGSRPGGGFRVRATLPVDAQPADLTPGVSRPGPAPAGNLAR
jgi:signal transduction histidine kinase